VKKRDSLSVKTHDSIFDFDSGCSTLFRSLSLERSGFETGTSFAVSFSLSLSAFSFYFNNYRWRKAQNNCFPAHTSIESMPAQQQQ